MTDTSKIIKKDIMRYTTNKLSSNLALLAVAFNVLYFLLMYSVKTSTAESSNGVIYQNVLMGISVILNLCIMLTAMLGSIQIKNYRQKACYFLIALGVVQLIRITGFPLAGVTHYYLDATYIEYNVFVLTVIYLVLSAACFIGSGVYGIITNKTYYAYKEAIECGEINIDEVLKEADIEAEHEAEELVRLETNVLSEETTEVPEFAKEPEEE